MNIGPRELEWFHSISDDFLQSSLTLWLFTMAKIGKAYSGNGSTSTRNLINVKLCCILILSKVPIKVLRLSKKSQCHPYTFVYISMINDHSVSSFYLAESTSRYRNSDDYYINKTHVKRTCAHNVITHTIFTCLRKYLQNVNLESV